MALHFQESGGKDSGEESLENVKEFTRYIVNLITLSLFCDKLESLFKSNHPGVLWLCFSSVLLYYIYFCVDLCCP